MQPLVSVVVPTHRRPRLLARSLRALLDQDLGPDVYEILVIDAEVDPDTRRVVESFDEPENRPGTQPVLRYLPLVCGRGPAAARNRGWRAARSPIVAFTDDDCVPEPDWLSSGLAAFVDGVTAVAGRIDPERDAFYRGFRLGSASRGDPEITTANCFCRRDALESVGGFNERSRGSWHGDTHAFAPMRRRGWSFAASPTCLVRRPLQPTRAWFAWFRPQRRSPRSVTAEQERMEELSVRRAA